MNLTRRDFIKSTIPILAGLSLSFQRPLFTFGGWTESGVAGCYNFTVQAEGQLESLIEQGKVVYAFFYPRPMEDSEIEALSDLFEMCNKLYLPVMAK